MNMADTVLKDILSSLTQTKASVESAHTKFFSEAVLFQPESIKQIGKDSDTSIERISLLSLKSSSLLAYVNDLALITLSHLVRMRHESSEIDSSKLEAIIASVKQRVTLEKGVKPLEKKISYQLDKMVRSFQRMEEEFTKVSEKVAEDKKTSKSSQTRMDFNSEESSEDEEDDLSHRPDAAALAKLTISKKSSKQTKETSNEKYKPPKISATAPPAAAFDDRGAPKHNIRKLQSMEEYLAEASELPQAEASIGATIVSHGRGGIKTSREKQKEAELQRYEESNFTRLPSTAMKKSFKQKMAERANNFAGEDWSMFSNNRDIKEETSRKRSSGTAWDRVKRSRS